MTYILNSPDCESLVGNTGISGCVLDPGLIVGCILIPKNKVYDATDIGDILTELAEDTMEAKGARVYPIFRFEEVADNSADVTVAAYGYGSEKVSRDGKYNLTFKVINGGVELQGNLRKFNQSKDFDILLCLQDGTLIGTKYSTDSLKGLTLDYFYAYPWKIADGSADAVYQVRIALAKPSELNEDIAFVATGEDIEKMVTGLLDLELVLITQAAATATVKVQTRSGKVNLYDSYSTVLNDLDNFIVTKAGVVVVPVSVALVAASESFVITLTTPTGEHVISLAGASVLDSNSIGGPPNPGYEMADDGYVTVTFA